MKNRKSDKPVNLSPEVKKALAQYGHSLNDVSNAGLAVWTANWCATRLAIDNEDRNTFDTLNLLNEKVSEAMGQVEAAYNEVMRMLGKP